MIIVLNEICWNNVTLLFFCVKVLQGQAHCCVIVLHRRFEDAGVKLHCSCQSVDAALHCLSVTLCVTEV